MAKSRVKRPRSGEREDSSEGTLFLRIATHHQRVIDNWTADGSEEDQLLLQTIEQPPKLKLDGSTAPNADGVIFKNGAYLNVAVALPGEGVVYTTVLVSEMEMMSRKDTLSTS